MAAWTALLAAAALAQAEPAASGDAAPAGTSAGETAAPLPAEAPLAGGAEAGMIVAPAARAGEFSVAGTLGLDAFPCRAGPLRLGFRFGLMGGGAGGDVCKGDRVSCGAAGFYGGVTGMAVLERRLAAAWLGVSTSGFFLLADDLVSRFSGLELARVAVGLDFPSPWGGGDGWIGLFGFGAYTTVGGHPPPLADSAGWLWGGGVRLTAAH